MSVLKKSVQGFDSAQAMLLQPATQVRFSGSIPPRNEFLSGAIRQERFDFWPVWIELALAYTSWTT